MNSRVFVLGLMILTMSAFGCGQREYSASPFGRSQIAFHSEREGNLDIYVMNADGTGQTRLTHNHTEDSYPTWSPDGSKILFESDRDGDFEIYVMDTDGSNITQLTHNEAGEFSSTWSPDGSKIAFVSFRDGSSEIYVMDADGSNQTRLTHNDLSDEAPHFSPDGSRIVSETGCGITFKAGSKKDLAEKILLLHGNPALRRRCAEKGKEFSLREYNWEKDGKRLLDAISRVCSESEEGLATSN